MLVMRQRLIRTLAIKQATSVVLLRYLPPGGFPVLRVGVDVRLYTPTGSRNIRGITAIILLCYHSCSGVPLPEYSSRNI